MPDLAFGPLTSFNDCELALLELIDVWFHSYLAARERKVGIQPGKIVRPRSYTVKNQFTALPGEEQTPLIIVVSGGFNSSPDRHGDSTYDVYLRMGIAAVVQGPEAVATRALAGHYQAALLGLLLKNRTMMDGQMSMCELLDLNMDDIPDEDSGRSLCAVRLAFEYKVQNFAEEYDGPIVVPPDPIVPQPDDPVVLTHDEVVEAMP